jgi:hypothetical protein
MLLTQPSGNLFGLTQNAGMGYGTSAGSRGMEQFSAEEGARRLATRAPREDLACDPALPDHTRLWATPVQASGGYGVDGIYDTGALRLLSRDA